MNFLLALLTSLLLTFSFPRFDLPWLMPVAMTPLLLASAREERALWRFLAGWLAGAGTLAGVTDWIRFVISFHGGLGTFGGLGAFLLYCLAKGLYFGVFAWLAGPVLRLAWAVPAVAALWVGVDITAGSALFQWVTLGNAAADMSIPMRLAPFAGVHALSFVFMMMSAAVALVLLRRPRWHIAWLLSLPALILLPPLPEPEQPSARAVVLQPNIDETREWTPQSLASSERELAQLSLRGVLRAGLRKPDLLIWPELPAPFYYYDDPEFRQLAGGLAQATRTPFLLGTVAHTPQGAPLNSALLLSPAGEPVARYDKIHLVPFGEYVPWPFGFFNKITREVGDFAPGAAAITPPLGGHRIGTFICYESAFPALVRGFVRNGAEVLFNLSNDGYFGRSLSARGQHLLVVRMRAAENARWIVRATNDGITASIDPAGRVIRSVPPFVETSGDLPYSYRTAQTFYSRHGDWFAWTCAALGLLSVLLARRTPAASR
ncbi:MAG TPA: apolipoprotein N-acyltransferase [Bryobacteraceae bacterium]|nr:apolipoprotein N-acyltransferase [Bryobacteraceae bacterium]